jgi:hypothetical protein
MKLKIYLVLIYCFVFQIGYGQAPNWEVQRGIYRYSTSFICAAFDECVETANANDIIGVFDKNDICRGKADFLSFPAGYRAFITIYGNATSEELYFRIYKADKNMVFYAYVSIVDFLAEAIQGTINAPIEVKYDSSIEIDAGRDQIVYNQTTTTLAATGDKNGNGSWRILYGGGGSFGTINSATSTFSGQYDTIYFLIWTVANPNCMDEMDHLFVTFKEDINVPVELVFFQGKASQEGNLLTWQTASEVNNEGFYIERSPNAKDWKAIGFVKGNGTTVETQDYSFLDDASVSGIQYYRLKQVDFDGQFEYSDIIVIHNELRIKNDELIMFPNPVQENLTIINGQGAATLYNSLGQVVQQFQIANEQFHMEVSALPQGIYTLQVRRGAGTVVVRQVVK